VEFLVSAIVPGADGKTQVIEPARPARRRPVPCDAVDQYQVLFKISPIQKKAVLEHVGEGLGEGVGGQGLVERLAEQGGIDARIGGPLHDPVRDFLVQVSA